MSGNQCHCGKPIQDTGSLEARLVHVSDDRDYWKALAGRLRAEADQWQKIAEQRQWFLDHPEQP